MRHAVVTMIPVARTSHSIVRVLIEAPVDDVLVVGHRRTEGHDQPPGPPYLRAGLFIDVLPQDRVVLLVDADRVGDVVGLTATVVQDGVQVGDVTEAVAAELQRLGHEPETPLTDVERRPPVVVLAGVAVRNDHLGERHPVGHRTHSAVVVIGDPVDDQAFAVVEAHPHGPLLPADFVAVDGQRRALGLMEHPAA